MATATADIANALNRFITQSSLVRLVCRLR
jgi:hypothetical protein